MNKQKRYLDLSSQSYRNNIFTFTHFCGEGELSDFYDEIKEAGKVHYELYGGHANADRLIVRFGDPDELGYDLAWPIVLLEINPINRKFAEELSHRDYLGSLMNIGIDRSMLGDIVVHEGGAFVFVHESIAEHVIHELTRVRHTTMTVSVRDELPVEMERKYETKQLQVASERIDVIVAKFAGLSRTEAAQYFHDRKIFVDGKVMENYSHQLKCESVVSVRGHGKFIYGGIVRRTRSDNLIIEIQVFC